MVEARGVKGLDAEAIATDLLSKGLADGVRAAPGYGDVRDAVRSFRRSEKRIHAREASCAGFRLRLRVGAEPLPRERQNEILASINAAFMVVTHQLPSESLQAFGERLLQDLGVRQVAAARVGSLSTWHRRLDEVNCYLKTAFRRQGLVREDISGTASSARLIHARLKAWSEIPIRA
jgi:hypothetical protein